MILAAWLLIAPSKPKSSIHTHKLIKTCLRKIQKTHSTALEKTFFDKKER